jgi:hypothetical protein
MTAAKVSVPPEYRTSEYGGTLFHTTFDIDRPGDFLEIFFHPGRTQQDLDAIVKNMPRRVEPKWEVFISGRIRGLEPPHEIEPGVTSFTYEAKYRHHETIKASVTVTPNFLKQLADLQLYGEYVREITVETGRKFEIKRIDQVGVDRNRPQKWQLSIREDYIKQATGGRQVLWLPKDHIFEGGVQTDTAGVYHWCGYHFARVPRNQPFMHLLKQ